VLPAAASLKKQGANNGATTAFLISTPESGVDSIAITYALLDPIMTVARPLAAFVTALVAGFGENIFNRPKTRIEFPIATACQIDNCCDDIDCPTEVSIAHHTFFEKVKSGLRFAVTEIWADLAVWFFIGIVLAGLIMVMVPDDIIATYLGGGINSMLLMLVIGVPLYICATASTPIAAALILKGISPGTALIFLLVGPATNITSLSVVVGLLGKRATALYLVSIVVVSVLSGLALDAFYSGMDISARAVVGQAAEVIPSWLQIASTLILVSISLKPLWNAVSSKIHTYFKNSNGSDVCDSTGCDCSSD
jgi:uncharacterized membrane protein YraQ (UPF0718 family)